MNSVFNIIKFKFHLGAERTKDRRGNMEV